MGGEYRTVPEDDDVVRALRPVTKAVDRGERELLLALRDRMHQAINDPRWKEDDLTEVRAELEEIERKLAALDAQAEEMGVASSELPDDVSQIVDYLAMAAQGYGGKLKWNEVHKVKGDLMNARRRWRPERVSVIAFKAKCLAVGLSSADTDELVDMLTRAQAGRRLVPKWGYAKFRFAFPFD